MLMGPLGWRCEDLGVSCALPSPRKGLRQKGCQLRKHDQQPQHQRHGQPERQNANENLAHRHIGCDGFDDEDIDVAVTKDDDDDNDIDFDEDDVDVDDTDGPGIIQDDITDGDELLPNLDNKDDQ